MRPARNLLSKISLAILAFGLLEPAGAGRLFADSDLPPPDGERRFEVGERITYSVHWGMIRAAEAVLEVHPVVEIDGQSAYHFSLTLRTTPLVDKFYKVRDRIDGFVRTDLQGSLLYLVEKDAGKNRRDVRVTYNRPERWAQYSNFGETREPVAIHESTFDPLSVLFILRELTLKKGSEIEISVSDGKWTTMGVARVKGVQRITVPAGNYRTILVEPEMKGVGGVFEKAGDAPVQVYYSNDERRIPVRLATELPVGTFSVHLVSIEQVPVAEQEQFAETFAEKNRLEG